MIPEGKYTARATGPQDAEFGEKDGKDFLFVRFEIKTGDNAGDTIGNYFRFASEAQAQFSVEALRKAGCTFDGGYRDLTGLGSKDVQLVIEHNVRNDKTYADIKYINSLGGIRDDQKMKPDQLSAFEKRMNGLLGPANPNAKKKTEGPPIDEDQIPF